MDCRELDVAWADAHIFLRDHDAGFAAMVGALLLASGTLLVFGEHTVRPLSALVGGIGGALGAFVISHFVDRAACETRLAVAGVTGLSLALLALCIYSKGLFLVGAAGFGTATHFAFQAVPALPRVPYYYVAVSGACAIGGIVIHCQRRPFVRICSSLLGAAGAVVAAQLVHRRSTERSLPSAVALVALLALTLGGVGAQHAIAVLRRRGPVPAATSSSRSE